MKVYVQPRASTVLRYPIGMPLSIGMACPQSQPQTPSEGESGPARADDLENMSSLIRVLHAHLNAPCEAGHG